MKKLALAVILAVILGTWSPAVYAFDYHVDPDAISEVFSGISLLRYYSNSLDFVIVKDTAKTEEYLKVMPFAHVPQTIATSAVTFSQSATLLSQELTQIDSLYKQHEAFINESRLLDALNASATLSSGIKQALAEVDALEQTAVLSGDKLKVASYSAQSGLRLTYDEVIAKIERIRAMLTFLAEQQQNSILENPVILAAVTSGNLTGANASDILQQVIGTLQSTNLILEITPTSAFVGDSVHFDAVLTSKGKPLPGRKAVILLNGSPYLTSTTDLNGHCDGELTIPHWYYIPQIEAQAFYQPQADDIGLFLASFSPPITINLLYYKVLLELSIVGKAYPGKTTIINGKLDYGTYPPLNNRKVSLYVDDGLVAELTANTDLSFPLALSTNFPLGEHTITLSAPANGRYAPAITSTTIEVTRASPILELDTPKVAFVPGNIRLSGKVYSDLGPLDGAALRINCGNTNVEITTASDGSFDSDLKIGIDFTLLGSRGISLHVSPIEPWNAPLSDTRSTFSINYVNCTLAALMLALLGIVAPNKLGKRLGYRRHRSYGIPETITLDIPPVFVTTPILQPPKNADKETEKPRGRIFYWYRQVLKMIQKIAGLVPRPQHTMREFAKESGSALGPISKYLLEITLLAERFLYGPHEALQTDAEKSRELSKAIGSEVKNEKV